MECCIVSDISTSALEFWHMNGQGYSFVFTIYNFHSVNFLQWSVVSDIWVSFGVFAHEWPKACFRSQLVHHCSKEAIPHHSERLPNTDETFGFTISSMQQHIPASTFVTNLHFQKAIRSGIQPPGTNCNLICHICTKLKAEAKPKFHISCKHQKQ